MAEGNSTLLTLIRQLKQRIDEIENNLEGVATKRQLADVHDKLDVKIDDVHDKLDTKIDRVHDELKTDIQELDAKIHIVNRKVIAVDQKIDRVADELRSEIRSNRELTQTIGNQVIGMLKGMQVARKGQKDQELGEIK